MKATTIGLDIAKRKMFLVGATEAGAVKFRKKLDASELLEFMSNQEPGVVAFEACGGSSYWGRKLREMGFTVKLVNPVKVAKIRSTQKNDYNDCGAIIELVQRSDTKFIGINEAWQQDIQSLHRMRTRVVRARVELVNQIHGLCLEYGIVLAEGFKEFKVHRRSAPSRNR